MNRFPFQVTTNVNGAGTATFNRPICGEVAEVRYGGTIFSGTATYTFTCVEDGGTILAYTSTANPWQRCPQQPVHSQTGGTTAFNTGVGPLYEEIPVDGYVKLVIANGGSAVTDSVQLYVDEG